MATYHLFMSHSWAYSDAYQKLVILLNKQVSSDKGGFHYKNFSVPKDDPIHNAKSAKELREAIERQMKPCSCILILAGVYATYSKWINVEIELAQKYNKKIIAIQPFAAEKTSKTVKAAANQIVAWRGKSIVDAIEAVE